MVWQAGDVAEPPSKIPHVVKQVRVSCCDGSWAGTGLAFPQDDMEVVGDGGHGG